MFARHDVSISDPATFAASEVLKVLRDDSRRVAKRQYEEGPGASVTNLTHLNDSHLLQKKRKKVVSAYVSRFAAKVYDDILPQAVSQSFDELQGIRRQRDLIAHENGILAAEIDRLEALRNGSRPPVKCEATDAVSAGFEGLIECPSGLLDGHVEAAFSSKCEDTAFSSSCAAVTEPVTPTLGATPQADFPFAEILDGHPPLSLEFSSECAEDESIISHDFPPVKKDENGNWIF